MAGSETSYTIACSGPLLLARGRACATSIAVERSGARVTPTAATCGFYTPGGTLAASPTVTIPSTDPTASYAADALDDYPLGEGYTERWTVTIDGVPRSARRAVVLSVYELHPPVTQADLVAGEYPELVDGLGDYAASLQAFMDTTWAACVRALARRSTPADVLVDPSDVFDWYRHAVLARVCKAQFRAPGDRWHELWRYHEGRAEALASGVRALVDRDRDGVPDSTDRSALTRTVAPNVPPGGRGRLRGFGW